MPAFCRHGRLEDRCPVCTAKARKAAAAAKPSRSAGPGARPRPARSSRVTATRRAGAGLVVRREARAQEDGYHHDLVPGLRATADAQRLADELAYAVARVDELSADPPGRYGDVLLLADDPEEALWLCLQIAVLSPLEADDPWSTIDAVRTSWADGALPDPGDLPLGPRAGIDRRRGPAATFGAYRAWAERAGSQVAAYTGEAVWTPQRRFDRAFERLALPGLGRTPRFELLVLVSRLTSIELEPWTLGMGVDASDPTVVAAKRVFGIGDAINLSRRAAELCAETGVPMAALDLALRNWSAPPAVARITAASHAQADPEVVAGIAAVLGALPPLADESGDADDADGAA